MRRVCDEQLNGLERVGAQDAAEAALFEATSPRRARPEAALAFLVVARGVREEAGGVARALGLV